jgi:EAL domain-containing protein (putative c-di-GMP-specific phosphodiesterase class I)
MRVAVNFSPRQFQLMDIAEMIEKVLADTPLEPCWLELEVPEDVILRNEEGVVQTLVRLGGMGVNISIEDFGTGYSALSFVNKIPFRSLKIDRSFISALCSAPEAEALVKAIISMAQCLNLNVVAEGVETENQRELLNSLDCSEMQGYLFSRPLPADEMSKYFDSMNKKRKIRRKG